MTREESIMNLACLSFAIGQTHPEESAFNNIEAIIRYSNAFSRWEYQNVLRLPNGWEDYMANGGEDYESIIYQWAKDFTI